MGKSYITLLNKIFTMVCSVVMFSFLIAKYQFVGAAWGMVLSFLISLIGNVGLLYLGKRYAIINH